MINTIYFSTVSMPASGLVLTWHSLKKVTDGSTYSPLPAFTEIDSGWYKYDYTDNVNLVGTIDGGSSLADSDRYKPISLNVSPNGDNQATITVMDVTTALVLSDVTITVKNNQQTLTINTGTTNTSGSYSTALSDGTYKILLRKASTNFTVPETMTITSSGSNTFTFYGSGFSPISIPSVGVCIIYGWVIDLAGNPVKNAKITAIETNNSRFSGINKIVKFSKSVISDANGLWEIELLWSGTLTPSGGKTQINITCPGFEYSKLITVPSAASVEFSTL